MLALTNPGISIFLAEDAYACLQSVPFNPAVGTRFLEYWNQTLQLHSTLAYLKTPPEGYQQPAIDVQKELSSIQKRVDSGFYDNQYSQFIASTMPQTAHRLRRFPPASPPA
jgi:hypothetical protein